MKIYVASSWRNLLQPAIVLALQKCGHRVYDFRNPIPDWDTEGLAPPEPGFGWSGIDPNWQNWSAQEYREALQHPLSVKGYSHDISALKACDACVLVLPSGRSASWEFGYAMGQGKRGVVVQFDTIEPELMYREAEIVTDMRELFDTFGLPGTGLEKGLTQRSVAATETLKVEPSCRACASCYLDDMDFICGHKDAGDWGKKVNVAASSEGHCGPSLKKFVQHPLRTPAGDIKRFDCSLLIYP